MTHSANMTCCLLGLAGGFLLFGLSAHASTIRVARDGSGEFESLFEAVEAAASGDTISIGPGVYTELGERPDIDSRWTYAAVVDVPVLTIIGDSRESVSIGPAYSGSAEETDPAGIVGTSVASIRLHHVTIRNVSFGLSVLGDSVRATDVQFLNCWWGLNASPAKSTYVGRCAFGDCTATGLMIANERGAERATVEDSAFNDCVVGLDVEVDGTTIARSEFSGGRVGLQVAFGASVTIDTCMFASHEYRGLAITPGSHALITDSAFTSSMQVNIDAAGSLSGHGNVLAGGTYTTIETGYVGSFDFHGNHILNAGGHTVLAELGVFPSVSHDFSGNFWGSTNTDQIDDWIVDRADDPNSNFIIIDYTPLADEPIPTETTNFGELKARY